MLSKAKKSYQYILFLLRILFHVVGIQYFDQILSINEKIQNNYYKIVLNYIYNKLHLRYFVTLANILNMQKGLLIAMHHEQNWC